MTLVLEERQYKPSQVSRLLNETFGHKTTPSVIRKWDNLILSPLNKQRAKERKEGVPRNYTKQDVEIFNAIAILRAFGYSLEEVRALLPTVAFQKGNSDVVAQIKSHIEKHKSSLGVLERLMHERNKVVHKV